MANAVGIGGVEKENLVGFSDGLVASEVTNVDAAIRKNHLRCGCGFFRALLAANTAALSVSNGDRGGFEESLNVEFWHGRWIVEAIA